jgi:hypothetical protein
MAMTEEQGAVVLSRFSNGESVKSVLKSLPISRSDFSVWRRENFIAFRVAVKAGRPVRGPLTREQKLKKLRAVKSRAQGKLDIVDAKIAEVELEDE